MRQEYDNKDIGEAIDKSFDAGRESGINDCYEWLFNNIERYLVMNKEFNEPDIKYSFLDDMRKDLKNGIRS